MCVAQYNTGLMSSLMTSRSGVSMLALSPVWVMCAECRGREREREERAPGPATSAQSPATAGTTGQSRSENRRSNIGHSVITQHSAWWHVTLVTLIMSSVTHIKREAGVGEGIPVVATPSRYTAPVHIDVGGKIYTSSLDTLTKWVRDRKSEPTSLTSELHLESGFILNSWALECMVMHKIWCSYFNFCSIILPYARASYPWVTSLWWLKSPGQNQSATRLAKKLI